MKRATQAVSYNLHWIFISIHALVKRATDCLNKQFALKGISIHALVKRATAAALITRYQVSYFNPRPREEGDHIDKLPYRL